MTAESELGALVERARAAGIELWAEGERLRFRAPPGALTDDVRSALRDRRAEVVRLLQREAEAAVDPGPVAANQQGLWLIHQLAPDSAAYHLAFSARVLGEVDVDVLREAFQILVDRHEALRTGYGVGPDGEPERRVQGRAPVELGVDAVAGDEQEVRSAVESAYREPFDLEAPPLLRAHLFTTSPDESVLLVVGHHIAIDGQSLFLLVDEFVQLYAALAEGSPLPARAEGADFGDFVDWQGRMLSDDPPGARYWEEILDPPPPHLEIPADRPRSTPAGTPGGTVTFEVGAEVRAAIHAFGTATGATDFTILLAAWAAWLARITGTIDVTIGSPVQGRPSVRFERTIGDFVNILPLRLRVDPALDFSRLLEAARSTVVEGLAHQDYPLPLMATSGRGGEGPPFQTMFALQDFTRHGSLQEWMLGGRGTARTFGPLELAPYPLAQQEGQFPLALDAWVKGEGWAFSCTYDGSLFDHATVERRMKEFATLLRAIAADPRQPVSTLPVVPASQRSQMDAWNDTATEVPESSVVDLVAAQSERSPDATAVVVGGAARSYADTLDRARRIGAALRDLGVEAGDRVGVLTDRSHDLLPILLGVMGIGAAYVPMDPRYPGPRLRQMMEDSGAAAVVTRGGGTAEVGIATPVLDLATASLPEPRPFAPVAPDATAYVIYTSGSTGRPKGVEVPHRTVVNFLTSMAREPGLRDDDVLLAVTTISFDISVLELFLPLTLGARVVIATEDETGDADRLIELMEREGVTVLQATPATWKLLVAAGWQGREGLRALCGGEALPASLAEQILKRVSELWNMYGPTETTVWSTVQRITGPGPIRIGRPIANTTVYVVDAHGQRVPLGVPGELWIGGAGVTRGYLGRPELTAERFLESPFEPGERLYRTGDRARLLPDGSLEHLGRLDHQVKIRGFRVEPGEIEARLLEHPDVSEAVVVAGEDRLLGYVVDGGALGPETLRGWVAETLPAYMVPSVVVSLPALPLTPNGKVDRSALPSGGGGRRRESAITLPRNAEEEAIAEIWRDVLGMGGVGVDRDFFALGGHSLAATRVVARVRELFGTEVTLRNFFATPTVAELARRVRTDSRAGSRIPEIVPCAPDHPPLSFSQERIWFLQVTAPENIAYNMAGAVLLEGRLDVERLRDAIDRVARRQGALRTRILAEAGRPYLMVDAEPTLTLRFEDVSDLPETARLDEARSRACDILDAPYDLEAGPLVRPLVFRLGEARHLFALGMHHIVSDLWSMALFGQEVAEAYNDPDATPVDEPEIGYADYAVWQREWLQGQPLDEQLAYWSDALEGVRTLDLPTDHPRPRFFSFEGGLVRVELPGATAARVQELTAADRATPFMAYLAAFKVLLATYSGQDDLAVGVPIANRLRVETERLIGSFVNTLVHRNDLSGDPTFREVLHRIRETALEAYAHQDLPFEILVKELNPTRETNRPPVVQVLFNVANVDAAGGEIDGVRRSVVPLPRRGAQFELALDIELNALQSSVALSFNRALFTRETAERLVEHFLEILERAAEDPDRPISELRSPPAADRDLQLRDWSRTDRAHAPLGGVPAMLSRTAARSPDAPAVVSSSGDWTWSELRRAAGRVTAELRDLGIGPGDRVGVLAERSREMLAGLVGIMGAGAAYVPLDPSYPENRIRYMVDHSGARAIVSHRGLEAEFHLDLPVVDLDADSGLEPIEFVEVDPESPAYVIYTSGSTGTPKGVEVPHRAVANFLHAMAQRPGLGEEDRLLAVTTISFDISVLELYLPLLTGARLVIADEKDSRDGRRLAHLISDEQITVMQATPATWKLLLGAEWEGSTDLRVLCGGEALPPSLAEELLTRSAELWNMYGPTETTVWSTIEKIEPGEPILVGRPIDNTRVYVLDEERRLLPIGVPGELWIAGDGVATGYFRSPDLTAERFVASPFRADERMYRTGDLARWRSDGRLEHLGRLDHQVKVRGFRIELGEVEAALRAHPDLHDVVVVARDDRLVAYTIPTLDAPSPGDLRRWLGERLPPYMIPSVFIPVQEFPLTPNGKVDRRALPEPGQRVPDPHRHEPPLGAEEIAIAGIWQELLEVPAVGRTDNFFELGGHSLLAMRAVALVEERMGHRVDPRSLFFRSLSEIAHSLSPSTES